MLCLIQDDVRSAYLRRSDVLTRQELDARNSKSRQQTAFEIIADRWNDSSFNPIAPSSICHEDFEDPTDCSYGTVISYSPATPQKVQDHLTSMRTDLLRIITAWESSGQGDGGYSYDDEDDDNPETSGEISATSPSFGALSGRNARALDQRSAFLRGKPSYLLYFWELMDQYQLLQSSLQIFNSESGASDASSVPSVIGKPSRRRGRQQDNENATANNILTLSNSLRFLAAAEDTRSQLAANREDERNVRRRLYDLQDLARNYRRMYAEEDNQTGARAMFYLEEGQRIQSEIEALERTT